MTKRQTTVEIMKLVFWGIISYLFYQWAGFNAVLGVIALLLMLNILSLSQKKKD